MIYEYKADLIRVVDGDTVWLNVDLGFRTRVSVDFRVAGLNAPEVVGVTKSAGLAAAAELLRLLSLGPIRVVSEKTEKYGRWLARLYVTTEAGEVDVNRALLDGGFATPYMT
jgi:micrococcal nuclease